jgi:hypothetical protein
MVQHEEQHDDTHGRGLGGEDDSDQGAYEHDCLVYIDRYTILINIWCWNKHLMLSLKQHSKCEVMMEIHIL